MSKQNSKITFAISLGSQALNITVDCDSFNLSPYASEENMCQTVILSPAEPPSDLVTLWTIGARSSRHTTPCGIEGTRR